MSRQDDIEPSIHECYSLTLEYEAKTRDPVRARKSVVLVIAAGVLVVLVASQLLVPEPPPTPAPTRSPEPAHTSSNHRQRRSE